MAVSVSSHAGLRTARPTYGLDGLMGRAEPSQETSSRRRHGCASIQTARLSLRMVPATQHSNLSQESDAGLYCRPSIHSGDRSYPDAVSLASSLGKSPDSKENRPRCHRVTHLRTTRPFVRMVRGMVEAAVCETKSSGFLRSANLCSAGAVICMVLCMERAGILKAARARLFC